MSFATWLGVRTNLGLSACSFLFLQLLLPTEDSRFVAGFFGFGDHSFALIRAGNGSPGENIFRVELKDAPCGFNGAVKILLGVIGLRQAMQRVAKFRIKFQRACVFRNCFPELSFAEEIYARVVVVFRALTRLAVHDVILAPVPTC